MLQATLQRLPALQAAHVLQVLHATLQRLQVLQAAATLQRLQTLRLTLALQTALALRSGTRCRCCLRVARARVIRRPVPDRQWPDLVTIT